MRSEAISAEERPPSTGYARDLVLAWARHSPSGEPRYIGELRPEQTGLKCECVCYSCGLGLEAVNAGKTEFRRRPHFRHPAGAQKDDCLVLAARAAALEVLKGEKYLILPRRLQSAKVEGLTGNFHQAWVASEPERVQIKDVEISDQVSAILTLDDGRTFRVLLVGKMGAEIGEDDEITLTPTIQFVVDDPEIAAMPPEEVRKRLTVIVDEGLWCSHWADADLTRRAVEEAKLVAARAMDWLDEESFQFPEGTSNEQKRETLLHIKAKEILEREKRIRVPDLVAATSRTSATGDTVPGDRRRPGQLLSLESVVLEQSVGRIRPDVVAHTVAFGDWPEDDLLIEITVTNTISEERLARIQAENRPTFEIDISRMGGIVTEAEFSNLIVSEIAGKRWLHHPWIGREEQKLRFDLETKVKATERQLVRQSYLQLPLEEICEKFLLAVETHAELLTQTDDNKYLMAQLDVARGDLEALIDALAGKGYPEVRDLKFMRGRILDRLLAIRHDRSIGYKLSTAWQVINTILQDQAPNKRWHTLYLTAIKIYQPTLDANQQGRISRWRKEVVFSLEEGKNDFRRDRKFDAALSILFPEMAEALAKPLPGDTPPKVLEPTGRSKREVVEPMQPYEIISGNTICVWEDRATDFQPKSRTQNAIVATAREARSQGLSTDAALAKCTQAFSGWNRIHVMSLLVDCGLAAQMLFRDEHTFEEWRERNLGKPPVYPG